jgi:NTE family protein
MPSSSRPRISLALSGGNALGAYAAGAYEALHTAGYAIDIISGGSIGAVTGAILAGNAPEQRVRKCASSGARRPPGPPFGLAPAGGRGRDVYNKMHAMQTVVMGRPGLFSPRPTGFMSMLRHPSRTSASSTRSRWHARSRGSSTSTY